MTHPAQHPKSGRKILPKIFLGIIAAGALALAPAPAFAQHGGGHVSMGSAHVAPGPAHMMGGGTHVATTSSAGMGMRASGNSFAAPAPAHFTAGNMSWQAPPARVMIPSNSWRSARPNVSMAARPGKLFPMRSSNALAIGGRRFLRPLDLQPRSRVAPLGIIPTPVHVFGVFRHRRFFDADDFFFFGGGCFDGFFPGFCGFGNGLFFGSPFAGCDPFWGWGCNGFGYNGSYYGYAPGVNYSDSNVAASDENGPFSWQNPPAENAEPGASAEQNVTLFYLTDGASYAVTDYWIAEGRLYYRTTYGGENSIAVDQLDWQRTVDENAARGVAFTLRPSPAPLSPE